jgi:hypothetical protein
LPPLVHGETVEDDAARELTVRQEWVDALGFDVGLPQGLAGSPIDS